MITLIYGLVFLFLAGFVLKSQMENFILNGNPVFKKLCLKRMCCILCSDFPHQL